jgi:cytoskeletal protein CcmA (bactofilin family)
MLGALVKHVNEGPCGTIDTLIGADVEFKGNIAFSGGLRIDGKVKGNITAADTGNNTLILGEHAEVDGKITVPHMIINGRIRGDVHCAERIELQSNARIVGDVHYKVMTVAVGAVIYGNLAHHETENDKKGAVTIFKPAYRPGDSAS